MIIFYLITFKNEDKKIFFIKIYIYIYTYLHIYLHNPRNRKVLIINITNIVNVSI